MDRFVLVKQSFYCNYDIIRFDYISITNAIKDISKLDVKDVDKAVEILNELYYKLFQYNEKEIILIIKELLITENNYSIVNILSALEVIQTSILRKQKLYQKYVNFIDNLQ